MQNDNVQVLTTDEVISSICYLRDFVPETEEEQRCINVAVCALQRVLRKRESSNKSFKKRFAEDEEFRRKRHEKDKRYAETHREQIREKNRKYRQENYTKEIVYAG